MPTSTAPPSGRERSPTMSASPAITPNASSVRVNSTVRFLYALLEGQRVCAHQRVKTGSRKYGAQIDVDVADDRGGDSGFPQRVRVGATSRANGLRPTSDSTAYSAATKSSPAQHWSGRSGRSGRAARHSSRPRGRRGHQPAGRAPRPGPRPQSDHAQPTPVRREPIVGRRAPPRECHASRARPRGSRLQTCGDHRLPTKLSSGNPSTRLAVPARRGWWSRRERLPKRAAPLRGRSRPSRRPNAFRGSVRLAVEVAPCDDSRSAGDPRPGSPTPGQRCGRLAMPRATRRTAARGTTAARRPSGRTQPRAMSR